MIHKVKMEPNKRSLTRPSESFLKKCLSGTIGLIISHCPLFKNTIYLRNKKLCMRISQIYDKYSPVIYKRKFSFQISFLMWT